MDLAAIYRNATLAIAGAKPVKSVIGRYGWRLGVGRFVAGEDIRSAVPALLAIQASGRHVILDLLGEFVESESASRAVADAVKECVAVARASGVEPYFSVKPTQLGLGVGAELALELADGVASAIGRRRHLCLDMENTPYVSGTLDLYEALRRAGHHHVSTVLQSYLFRTPDDLDRLIGLAGTYPDVTTALRLVKGAYRETAEHAIRTWPASRRPTAPSPTAPSGRASSSTSPRTTRACSASCSLTPMALRLARTGTRCRCSTA